jgi:hypothetical protein
MDDTQTTTLVIVIVVVIALALLLWFFLQRRRSQKLHDRYGEEYERTVADLGKRDKAEANLLEREKRIKTLDIRPLSVAQRQDYENEWLGVKALFVDSPAEATLHGDRLLGKMMQARGYPMADFDRRYEDLTVDHGDVARHYREGHKLAERQTRGEASTEDLRQALIHYEALFAELVRDAVPDSDVREAQVQPR